MTITAGTATSTHGYTYNSLDQMKKLTRNSVDITKFVYDEQGNISSITYTNGTYTSFEYDDANRLKVLEKLQFYWKFGRKIHLFWLCFSLVNYGTKNLNKSPLHLFKFFHDTT